MSEPITFKVLDKKERLDKYLTKYLKENSRSQIQTWIKEDRVLINDEKNISRYVSGFYIVIRCL